MLHNGENNTISQSETYPTGLVKVTLDKNGSATYDIHYPSAWDKISISDEIINKVSEADAFVFGSLICRDEVSRATLYALLDKANYKILDANLRAPYYTIDILIDLMNKADFIKLNDEELREISVKMGSPFNSFEQSIKFIAEKTNTKQICVTKGAFGAVLYNNGKLVELITYTSKGEFITRSYILNDYYDIEKHSEVIYHQLKNALIHNDFSLLDSSIFRITFYSEAYFNDSSKIAKVEAKKLKLFNQFSQINKIAIQKYGIFLKNTK